MTTSQYIHRFLLLTLTVCIFGACSSTKFVPDSEYLLDRVEVSCQDKSLDAATLEPYIRQQTNSKWFSVFKIPLYTYSLAGRDTTAWLNRKLKSIGEEPVIYDPIQEELSRKDLIAAMHNLGYMHAQVEVARKHKGKKIRLNYQLSPGEAYKIGKVEYYVFDPQISSLLHLERADNQQLKSGSPFTVDRLDQERKRITSILNNEGYYKFHKDYIRFEADSARNENDIHLRLVLHAYQGAPTTETAQAGDSAANDRHSVFTLPLHPRYKIGEVRFHNSQESYSYLRESILRMYTQIKPGQWYSQRDLQNTYNNFARLGAVRYTNIRFTEQPDTTLNCDITISTHKPKSISIQPEGTNTAGDLGAAIALTYENRNLFHGSESFSLRLRGAFEAITGLEGYQDQDYQEYGIEAALSFPRLLAPFHIGQHNRLNGTRSNLSVSWNMQNRPEFHRRVFTTAWRYRWTHPRKNLAYRLDLIDLNYIYMPWISATFRADYLDNETSRNAILRYNYEDLFIMRIGFGLTYSGPTDIFRFNIETAGNLLDAIASAADTKVNNNGQHTLFNIAYAQYLKADFDYTHLLHFDQRNTLALHASLGIACPYGNSKILPFEKRYFSGGANSVRGWNVRELGPGRFRGTDGRIDFINQTGDMKLDFNAELRSRLFWKFQGALFVDAGNIWTLRNYEDQLGGQFKLKNLLRQMAVAYGAGLRLDFDYFLVRLDLGMKAINPAYNTHREHYPVYHPSIGRDLSVHFAVGLPF